MVLLIRHQTIISTSQESGLCKSSAKELKTTIEELLSISSIIQEISFYSVELPASRQFHLDRLCQTLKEGLELSQKVLNLGRWKIYKNLMLSRKMEKLAKKVSMFSNGSLQAHVLADVHHMRFETAERFDRLNQRLGEMEIAARNGWLVEEAERVEIEEDKWVEDLGVVGISGKTTLTAQVFCVGQVTCYFNNRIFFLKTRRFPLRCLSICDIDEEEAFAILVELAERNLVTLKKKKKLYKRLQ